MCGGVPEERCVPIRLRQTPTTYSRGCALDSVAEMGGEPSVRCPHRHGENRTFDFERGLADGGMAVLGDQKGESGHSTSGDAPARPWTCPSQLPIITSGSFGVGSMDIGDWLRGFGLGQYEAVFRENDIDADMLRS